MHHMLNARWFYLLVIIAVLGIFVSNPFTPVPANAGGTYVFSVTCTSQESLLVEWRTGDIDPGKEYLRVATGQKYPSCSIGDYNEATDAGRRKETYSHEAGVIAGLPVLGPIICGLFGC